jgi:hypothetical protein
VILPRRSCEEFWQAVPQVSQFSVSVADPLPEVELTRTQESLLEAVHVQLLLLAVSWNGRAVDCAAVYVFGMSTKGVRLNVQTGAIDVVVDVEIDVELEVEVDVVVDVVEPGTVVVVPTVVVAGTVVVLPVIEVVGGLLFGAMPGLT